MSTKDLVIAKVQIKLKLATKKEAELVLNQVVESVEQTLLDHLKEDGFSLKLNGFGKFSVHHKPSIRRKIPFTGEIKQTLPKRKIKYVSLGKLREQEVEK
jgi:nucleoid DNA-binding protein